MDRLQIELHTTSMGQEITWPTGKATFRRRILIFQNAT